MTKTILLDMNLTPDWVPVLQEAGWNARHWTTVGPVNATDAEIMEQARRNDWIVMTQDLDFTILLALTHADGPSVVQVRSRNSRPEHLREQVVSALQHYYSELEKGALVVIDDSHHRMRVLPF